MIVTREKIEKLDLVLVSKPDLGDKVIAEKDLSTVCDGNLCYMKYNAISDLWAIVNNTKRLSCRFVITDKNGNDSVAWGFKEKHLLDVLSLNNEDFIEELIGLGFHFEIHKALLIRNVEEWNEKYNLDLPLTPLTGHEILMLIAYYE